MVKFVEDWDAGIKRVGGRGPWGDRGPGAPGRDSGSRGGFAPRIIVSESLDLYVHALSAGLPVQSPRACARSFQNFCSGPGGTVRLSNQAGGPCYPTTIDPSRFLITASASLIISSMMLAALISCLV